MKISGTTAVAFALGCGSEIKPKEDRIPPIDPWVDTREVKYGAETTTICPFCAVGCGIVVTSNWVDGVWKVVNTEGDPDHPINEGTLCSKGSSLYQVANNERRLKGVMHRTEGEADWDRNEDGSLKYLEWDTAISMIADKIKETRDNTFVEGPNRCDGIAVLGGAALDNEECYLLSKLARALGITYLEHQARI